MKFLVQNSFTELDGPPNHIHILDKALCVKEKGAHFAKAYRKGYWDGYTHLLKNKQFRTGLLPYCLRVCAKSGINTEIVDLRKTGPDIGSRKKVSLPDNIKEIRDFQKESVNEIFSDRVEGIQFYRGIIEIGTGGGKTLVIALLCTKVQAPTLVLVNSIDLLSQTALDLAGFLKEEVGMIGNGKSDLHCRVTVSTIQTLSRNLEAFLPYLIRIENLVIDECHHTSAKSFMDVADACVNASIRVGLSGTPFKDNDPLHIQQLRSVLGDPIVKVDSSRLIQEGVVAPVTVLYFPVAHPQNITKVIDGKKENFASASLQYRETFFEKVLEAPGAYEELIIRNEYRNKLFCDWILSRTRPTLVIVDRLEHGRILQEKLKCPFLSGAESGVERALVLDQIKKKELMCVIATPIFDEGVNAPAIKYLALMSGGKAPGRLKQRIGRGMRKTGEELVVLDSLDLTHRILAQHSKQRLTTCVKAGFKIKRVEPDELRTYGK